MCALRRSKRLVPDRQRPVSRPRSRSHAACRRHPRGRQKARRATARQRRRCRDRAHGRCLRAPPRSSIADRQARSARGTLCDPSRRLARARAAQRGAPDRAVDQRPALGGPGSDRPARASGDLAQPTSLRAHHGNAPGQRRRLATAQRAGDGGLVEPPTTRPGGHRGARRAAPRRSVRRLEAADRAVRTKRWQPPVLARAGCPGGRRWRDPGAAQLAAGAHHRQARSTHSGPTPDHRERGHAGHLRGDRFTADVCRGDGSAIRSGQRPRARRPRPAGSGRPALGVPQRLRS